MHVLLITSYEIKTNIKQTFLIKKIKKITEKELYEIFFFV